MANRAAVGAPGDQLQSSATLLSTKLFVPRSRQRLVSRPRLDALLDRNAALTLVSAPAGFGKSTVVVDWLRRRDVRVSWLSLERSDDEPRRFLQYLLAVWRRLVPHVGVSLEAALDEPGPFLGSTEQTAFVNEIGGLAEAIADQADDLVLVLDDYHAVEDSTIHRFVAAMVDALPPGIRLVITTRVDPPFPLARMRAFGRLEEVRAADLRFSADEASSFLSEAMGVELAEGQAEVLQERTEGWIVGLQLAAISLRGRLDVTGSREDSTHDFLRDFSGSHRFVLDYLTDEVLGRQDEATLDLLLRISMLDEICGQLADAVTGGQDGQDRLESLEAENLFLIPLDQDRRWYRFHHLFAECLRRYAEERLAERERHEIHRRAFEWLYEHDRPDAALDHALAADDAERARRLLRTYADATLHLGDVDAVSRWLVRVPPSWIAHDPPLALTRALVRFLLLDWSGLTDMEAELGRELEGPPHVGEEAGSVAGRKAMLGLLALWAVGDMERAAEAGRAAVQLLPEPEVLLRGTAVALLSAALVRRKDWPETERMLQLGRDLNRASQNRLALSTCYYNWSRLRIHQGRPEDALRIAREGLDEITRRTGGQLTTIGCLVALAEAEALLELG
ncbi:MAG: hypothetical protein MPN21_22465, partial [Thermoanaerobaculia bacterium]|nr:hypothetical protein [Thermoanaerobaculia bacterium]